MTTTNAVPALDLVTELRALARLEHLDMSVVADAADEIERLRTWFRRSLLLLADDKLAAACISIKQYRVIMALSIDQAGTTTTSKEPT